MWDDVDVRVHSVPDCDDAFGAHRQDEAVPVRFEADFDFKRPCFKATVSGAAACNLEHTEIITLILVEGDDGPEMEFRAQRVICAN